MKKGLICISVLLCAVLLTMGLSVFGQTGEADGFATDNAPSIADGHHPKGNISFKDGVYTESIPQNLAGKNIQGAEKAIYEGLLNHESEINVKNFNLTDESLRAIFTNIRDSYPELFHVSSKYSYNYFTDTGIIVKLQPQYVMTKDEYEDAYVIYKAEIDSITSVAKKLSNDLEKILYVHDYICANYEYDTSYTIYDAYNFVLNRKGVCQSYTLMMIACGNALGIDISWAQSDAMNHIWNVVKIDGVYYHIDATWDDPTGGIPYYANHDNFLLSDTGISGEDHHSWTSNYVCTSTKYDGEFWRSVRSPFAAIGNELYYVDKTNKYLCNFDGVNFTTLTLAEFDDRWYASSAQTSYYPGMYSGLAVMNNLLVLNTPEKVLIFAPQSGEMTELISHVEENMFIYSLNVYSAEGVYCYIAPNPNDDGKIIYKAVPEKFYNINVSWIKADGTVTGTYKLGDIPYYSGEVADIYVDEFYHNTFYSWDKIPSPVLTDTEFNVNYKLVEHKYVDHICSCGAEEYTGPKVLWEGTHGDLLWTIEDSGILSIEGQGAMKTLSSDTYGWRKYAKYVKHIIVREGVTTLGDNCFENMSVATQITLPSTITSIGNGAFNGCSSLTDIYIDTKKFPEGWNEVFMTTATPVVHFTSNVGFKSASVVFEAKMTIKFQVDSSYFEGVENLEAVVERHYKDDRGNVREILNNYVVNGLYYVFSVTEIAAKEMNDTVVSTLVCEMNGTVVEFKPVDYSIVTYAKNSLSKASNSAEFKTLLVDMLNYGSMAQIYLNYGTDALANSTLTEEEKAYASYNAGDDITLETVKSYVPISGETVSFRSVAAVFADSVELKYLLNLTGYKGDKENISVVFKYSDVMGNEIEKVIAFNEMTLSGDVYFVVFEDIATKDMGTILSSVIYENYGTENEKAISGMATYSIESYAHSKMNSENEALRELVRHMMAFSRSAKSYFTNK